MDLFWWLMNEVIHQGWMGSQHGESVEQAAGFTNQLGSK